MWSALTGRPSDLKDSPPTAASRLANGFGRKTLSLNCGVDALFLEDSKAEKPWPAELGDNESHQQAHCVGHADDLCLTSQDTQLSGAQLGGCPEFNICYRLYFIYLHF